MSQIKKIVIVALFMITASVITTITPCIAHPSQIRFNATASKSSMIINPRPIMLNNLISKPSLHEISTTSSGTLPAVHVSAPSVHTNNVKKSAVPVIPLSAAERDKVERVVMASCGELDNPQMAEANAQVILDRTSSGLFGNNINAVLSASGQFEKPWKGHVNSMVKEAVSKVFDSGKRITSQQIYFYINPNICNISLTVWKRDKCYVTSIGKGIFVHQYWTIKT